MKSQIETERKYIIKMPDISLLEKMENYRADEILQIYLPSDIGVTRRIRSRRGKEGVVYTETKKIKIGKMSSIEEEGEISEKEFFSLKENILEGSVPIKKVRHTFSYHNQIFEVDIYPQWRGYAIMEAEIPDENAEFSIPGEIIVVEEVTGRREYSNASMSRKFPEEPIL